MIKIETWINHYLGLIAGLLKIVVKKLTPTFVTNFLAFLKSLPFRTTALIKQIITNLKHINLKENYQATYNKIIEQVEQSKTNSPFIKFNSAIKTPFVMIYNCFSDLNTSQTVTLMSFTVASVFAIFGIIQSSNQILGSEIQRAPASVEIVEVKKPDYHLMKEKTFELFNLRIPVYFANTNELRTMDIDLSAILSNRNSKNILEKFEFQIRDHFILNLEPVKTEFTLTEEGREIIRQKLAKEIQLFMDINNIEGDISELKVTYALAN